MLCQMCSRSLSIDCSVLVTTNWRKADVHTEPMPAASDDKIYITRTLVDTRVFMDMESITPALGLFDTTSGKKPYTRTLKSNTSKSQMLLTRLVNNRIRPMPYYYTNVVQK